MSFSDKLKVLLDSTYLLPIVGVEVENVSKALRVLRKLRKLGMLEVYYTPFNIVEILGKISKMRYDRNIVLKGLTLIEEEFKLTYLTAEGYMKALELKSKGFKDLIDLLLYTTSLTRNLKFLTRDAALIDFLRNLGERMENLVYEEDFIRKHGIGKA